MRRGLSNLAIRCSQISCSGIGRGSAALRGSCRTVATRFAASSMSSCVLRHTLPGHVRCALHKSLPEYVLPAAQQQVQQLAPVGIGDSIGIPPNLLLPAFDFQCQTNSQPITNDDAQRMESRFSHEARELVRTRRLRKLPFHPSRQWTERRTACRAHTFGRVATRGIGGARVAGSFKRSLNPLFDALAA